MAEAEAVSRLEALEEAASLRRERGLWSDAYRRLIRNRLAMVSLVFLSVIVVLALLGNNLDDVRRYHPTEDQIHADAREGPSGRHFFGTDILGRDMWSRVLQGTLISLQVGFGVQAVVVVVGLLIGGLAALGGRLMDNLMMRFTDLAYAFPDLLFIILMRAVLAGRELRPDWVKPYVSAEEVQVLQLVIAISFVGWVTIARLVRGQMLSLKERDFVLAARAMGASGARVVFLHMLPNTLGPVIVAVVFGIPVAIFSEAVLGFIGFGITPPTASLGRLVQDGRDLIFVNEWVVIFPTATIALLMLCFTFLGDGLRDALDPRQR